MDIISPAEGLVLPYGDVYLHESSPQLISDRAARADAFSLKLHYFSRVAKVLPDFVQTGSQSLYVVDCPRRRPYLSRRNWCPKELDRGEGAERKIER